jgi:hypothetical protein
MRFFLVLIFSPLFTISVLAQSDDFELTYAEFAFFPTPFCDNLVKIKNDSLWYFYKQKSKRIREIETWGNSSEHVDTIWLNDTMAKYTKFRQGSIDSIIQVVKQIHPNEYMNDSLVFASNPGIIDGGIIGIDLKYGKTKKLRIELGNTFDSTALRIVNIINPYLPDIGKIYIPYSMWKKEIEYWRRRDSIYSHKHHLSK